MITARVTYGHRRSESAEASHPLTGVESSCATEVVRERATLLAHAANARDRGIGGEPTPATVERAEPQSTIRVPLMRSPMAGLALGSSLLFLVLVGLRVHGFSLPFWHDVIDGSPRSELLLGRPRSIRGDDWYVHLPLILGQAAHDPAFPLRNENIGLGQQLILPIPVPIRHPITLFRPVLWGFFLGNDLGLAWMWWSRVLGIFLVWTWVCWIVTNGHARLSILGGLLVLMAPLVQFWSFNSGAVLISSGLVIIAGFGLLKARSSTWIAASGLLLAWSITAFVMEFYPPYQVVLGYLIVAVLIGSASALQGSESRSQRRLRVIAAVSGAALGILASAALLFEARHAIEIIARTAYPGARVSTGGQYPVWWILNNDLWTMRRLLDQRAVGYGVSWLFFPVLAAAELLRLSRRRLPTDPISTSLLVYLAALLTYACVGFPVMLARASLFSWVLDPRVSIGFCTGDALLLVRYLSRTSAAPVPSRVQAAVIAMLWVGLLGACASVLHDRERELRVATTVIALIVNGTLAFGFLRRTAPVFLLGAVVAGLAWSTLWFNPLVVGGSDYLAENPLSQRILEIDRSEAGRSFWAVFGAPPLPNLLRTIGVHALNGVQPIPQLELWSRLDPGGTSREIYNRYAHVLLQPGPSETPSFHLVGPDAFSIQLSPTSPILRCVGVTHVLLQTNRPESFKALEGLQWLGSVGPNHVFRLDGATGKTRCPKAFSEEPGSPSRHAPGSGNRDH